MSLKPANIFLTSRSGLHDFMKILDFGLVKAFEGGRKDETHESPRRQRNSVLLIAGGPLWEGMAWCLITGLMVATLLSLLVVPALYAIFVEHLRVKPFR